MKTSAALLHLSRLSFYVLLALMPLSSAWLIRQHYALGLASHYVSILGYVSDIPLGVTVLAWLAAHLLEPGCSLHLCPRPLSLMLMALVGLSLLSTLWALEPVLSIAFSARLACLFALYAFVINEMHDHRWAALSLGGGVALQSLVALGQFLTGGQLGLTALGEPPVYTFTLGASVIEIGTERWLRGYGLSPSPNIFGGVVTAGLFALLGLRMSLRTDRFLLSLSLSLLAATGLMCAFSRGAWLGFGVGLLVLGVLLCRSPAKPPRRAYWGLVAMATGVAAVFVFAYPQLFAVRAVPTLDGGNSLEELSLTLREQYQKTARDLIERYPLGGVGSSNYVLATAIENPPTLAFHSYQPVHNTLLLVTAELGLPGGMLCLAAGFYVALAVWRSRVKLGEDPWLLTWTAALLAICVIGFFDHYLWTYQQGRLLVWVSLGLWTSAAQRHRAGSGGQAQSCAEHGAQLLGMRPDDAVVQPRRCFQALITDPSTPSGEAEDPRVLPQARIGIRCGASSAKPYA